MIDFPKPAARQFLQTLTLGKFAVTSNEDKLLFVSNLSGKMNLWSKALPVGFPSQLTFENQSIGSVHGDPKGRYTLITSDVDGDENYKIKVISPAGGQAKSLIPAEQETKQFISHLSDDGEYLYYATSQGNPEYFNSFRRNVMTGEEELLVVGEDALTTIESVSEDGYIIAYVKKFSNTHSLIEALDGDKTHVLSSEPEEIQEMRQAVVAGRKVYYLTNLHEDHHYLAAYDLDEQLTTIIKKLPNASMDELDYDAANHCLYVRTLEGAIARLYRLTIADKGWREVVTPFDMILSLKIAASGALYVLGSTSTSPMQIFTFTGSEWEPIVTNRVPGVPEEMLVEAETITYSSFDGLQIEALWFKASDEVSNRATIFWPHGGPQSLETKAFRAYFQYWLANGYSVFAPNFRGSAGYGSDFMKMVERDWGYGPRLDCVKGAEWLFDQGYATPETLYCVGGSYGGYMTLLLHGRHSDLFRAFVDIFGPCDLFTFYHSVPDHWKQMMDQFVGNPDRDKAKFIEDSPITYLENMIKPMMVVQGANDPRVVQAESDKIVNALRDKGVEVEYLLLEDEGHGFSKKENELLVFEQIVKFLDKQRLDHPIG
ncbi:hypothetical protein CHH91_00905 [Virgibacillus sp. 7505]|uniref:S9 family peptidase n=1 Tax=Virgibacillus sp. 7505 TaxID=2022548 RepID=UPI000BA6EE94|nr:S9 family peptidase [Virgibacillus sp. 7505]PAE18097.1 hypothetical protein CHH91_00905 [Virgibacillus sp. 7505]